MNQLLEGPLVVQNRDSDAYLRPACSDVVFVRGIRVDVPAGFQLAKGRVLLGDLYLSYVPFMHSNGTDVRFVPADRFVGQKVIADVSEENAADSFAMLIRPVTMED